MSEILISRRAVALGLAAAIIPLSARAQGEGLKFRAIEVDVRPLRATGDTLSADVIAQELPAALRAELGGHLVPGDRSAPILRARIDTVSYGTPGSSARPLDSDATHDWIEGVGQVVGPGGRILATYPLTANNGVDPHPDDITGTDGHNRIVNLARIFAHWLPGKLGL
jgi:hypothetical protein